jgi:hypothetical protein
MTRSQNVSYQNAIVAGRISMTMFDERNEEYWRLWREQTLDRLRKFEDLLINPSDSLKDNIRRIKTELGD